MKSRNWSVAPILGVARVREAAEHYRDVLGFELDPVDGVFAPSPAEPQGVYAIVMRGGASIHFQIRREPMPPRSPGTLTRDVYVFVDDLDALHADFVKRGAKVIAPPHMAPHGIREVVVDDLNGFRLAFGEIA